MLSSLVVLVVLAAAGRVGCSCTITTDGTADEGCTFNRTTLQVGVTIVRLHPECMSYTCLDTNVISKCGIGYNDEIFNNAILSDFPGTHCNVIKNQDCSVSVDCFGNAPTSFPPFEEMPTKLVKAELFG